MQHFKLLKNQRAQACYVTWPVFCMTGTNFGVPVTDESYSKLCTLKECRMFVCFEQFSLDVTNIITLICIEHRNSESSGTPCIYCFFIPLEARPVTSPNLEHHHSVKIYKELPCWKYFSTRRKQANTTPTLPVASPFSSAIAHSKFTEN